MVPIIGLRYFDAMHIKSHEKCLKLLRDLTQSLFRQLSTWIKQTEHILGLLLKRQTQAIARTKMG
jgi:hypothetical protein